MDTLRRAKPTPDNRWGPLPPHTVAQRWSPLRWLERALWVIGVVLIGYFGYVSAEAALYQAQETRELEAILASAPVPAPENTSAAAAPVRRPSPAPGSTIGRIEIPSLGVSTVVRAGTDARTLRLAVGHIAGTSVPGDPGNVGLAAHRDTFFRRLGEIEPGDEVRVVTSYGTFAYRVAGTQIVDPSDVWVLDPTDVPALTLVTCYPFRYIGAAPRRFIVRAHLIEG